MTRARIALVSVRFKLFDAQMSADFPARMQAHTQRSAAILEQWFDVVRTPLIEDDAGAAVVAAALAGEHVDAVVFAPTMAAPPTYAQVALAGSDAPLVIWNAPSIMRIPADYHQDEATVHSSTVGALMYGNVLQRQGRAAAVVTAGHDDAEGLERLQRTVRAVAAAGALRGSTFLRVGSPIPGYTDVETTDAELAQLGVREASLTQADWESTVSAVSSVDAQALLDDVASRWQGEAGPEGLWSARVAVALARALDETDAVGGTVNCHGPWLRNSEVVGLPACLGVACATEGGPTTLVHR